MSEKYGNIGEEEYRECLKYFEKYWTFFIEKNPAMNEEKWMDVYFMVFLSGFSAGIKIGEQKKQSLIEEIVKSN